MAATSGASDLTGPQGTASLSDAGRGEGETPSPGDGQARRLTAAEIAPEARSTFKPTGPGAKHQQRGRTHDRHGRQTQRRLFLYVERFCF
jgi:hypothetical protein